MNLHRSCNDCVADFVCSDCVDRRGGHDSELLRQQLFFSAGRRAVKPVLGSLTYEMFSKIPAAPMPPPTHMVTIP